MKRDNGQGMFTMPIITAISTLTTLEEAKEAARIAIDGATATDQNKAKATAMVNQSHTIKNLVLGMANFSLAHQGLGTMR